MHLGELIKRLEMENQIRVLPIGFKRPHSYRGHYADLAFERAENVTIGEMLTLAKSALGETFTGYKGGHYVMKEYTDVWLAEYGQGDGETIGPLLLDYMLKQ